jgi:hypothetical protein
MGLAHWQLLDRQGWIASHAVAIDVIEAGGQRWVDEIDVHSTLMKQTPIKGEPHRACPGRKISDFCLAAAVASLW